MIDEVDEIIVRNVDAVSGYLHGLKRVIYYLQTFDLVVTS